MFLPLTFLDLVPKSFGHIPTLLLSTNAVRIVVAAAYRTPPHFGSGLDTGLMPK